MLFAQAWFFTVLQTVSAQSAEKDRVTLERLVEPLLHLARSYEGGREGHACSIVQTLFNGYLLVEELFNDNAQVCFCFRSVITLK